jgi:hypothetical protein
MQNIRPAKAFSLARETPNFVYFASFFGKIPFECVKNNSFGIWMHQFFLARHEI